MSGLNVHSWQMPQSNSLVIKRLRCINIRWSEVNIKQNWLTIISACHERSKEASELPAAPHTDRLLSLFDDKLHGALVLYLYAFSQLAVYSQENLIACFNDFHWHPSWRIKRVQKAPQTKRRQLTGGAILQQACCFDYLPTINRSNACPYNWRSSLV